MELYRLLIIYNSIDVKSLEHLFWWWNCQGINCGSRGFYFLRIQNPDVFVVFLLNFVTILRTKRIPLISIFSTLNPFYVQKP